MMSINGRTSPERKKSVRVRVAMFLAVASWSPQNANVDKNTILKQNK